MYNRYFGFSEFPFSTTPDPRFFYGNDLYLEAYANLRYGIEAKKGFIAVTGEVGTGKTTLLRKLMRSLQEGVDYAFIFNTDITFDHLLRMILRDLGLRPRDYDRLAMIDELNGFLLDQARRGHTVCVLIDEAQNLSEESLEGLRLLSNFETDREKLLQIVLMGQTELKTKLDQSRLRQLKQRIAIHCELSPLAEEEVGRYIDFRLRAGGYRGSQLFDADAVRDIATYSKGIPRLINVICDNALLVAFALARKQISAEIIREVAHDLRITPPATLKAGGKRRAGADGGRRTILSEALHRFLCRALDRKAGIAIRSGWILVLASALAFFVAPGIFLRDAGQRRPLSSVETSKSTRSQAHAEAAPAQTGGRGHSAAGDGAPPRPGTTGRTTVIRYGSTLYQIASDTYGPNTLLGLDLIKEFNPRIENLSRVAAGEKIFLPAIDRSTRVRRGRDGTYRVLAGSYLARTRAVQAVDRIEKEGYEAEIAPRRVANDLLLHRVEIHRLRTLAEVGAALDVSARSSSRR